MTVTPQRIAWALLLAACNPTKGTLTLDEATVSARLQGIADDVPGCDLSGASAARTLASPLRQLQGPGPLRVDDTQAGACGGSLDVTSEHSNGTTTYDVLFNQLCVTSADGDVVMNGTLHARQEGTPSDDGPVIAALEVNTDGPIVLAQNGQTIDVTVDSVRTEYGVPAAWYPGEPTTADPDVTTLSHASARFSSDGREEYVRDVVYTRAGAWDATYEITDGILGREGEDFVTIRTPPDEPLVINVLGLQIQSGALELGGAGGAVLQVRPDGVTAGVLTFTLDDAPFAAGLSCAAAREPLVLTAMSLLQVIPVP